ncbi:MAG TPA: sodium:solute symporter family protein [Gemmatimonadales bacterium]|nr:sodium:solute symporter family protein [Gemmatimonadales bacterium]
MTPVLWAIAVYLAIQFGIGIWVSRRIRTEAEYLVAGRRLGYPLAIFSIFATWFGAETIVGSAGRAHREGVSLASAEPFGYALCLILMGLVFAAPLWRRGLTTLADLFRQRYSVKVERFAAITLIPSSILWAAAQMRAFGSVLASSSSLETEVAVGVAAGITIAYTMFGGLLVDAITDVIQGVILILGLVVLGATVLWTVGGPDAARTAIIEGGRLGAATASGSWLDTLEAWAIPVCGSVVATELVARVIATPTATVARRSALIAGGLYLMVGLIPVFIGIVGLQPTVAPDDPEQLIPTLARELLPTAAYAAFVGAFISAILSTVDSTLLVPAGLFSHNLVVPLVKAADERFKVRVARAAVVAFGITAYLLARHAQGVFALVEQASAFGSAGSLVVVGFGLFTHWGGPRTALATLAAGLGAYLAGLGAEWPHPFLTSLGAALVTYAMGAIMEAHSRWPEP